MIIHKVWTLIFKTFRRRRFRLFLEKVQPDTKSRILDVGGYPQTWATQPVCSREVHIVNVHEVPQMPDSTGHHFTYACADGRKLPYADREFDVGFSNSVIEHVGGWEEQKRFAGEMRRTGQKLWVQTPAQEFWMEPHYLTPFIHWLPKELRIKLARNFTVWGWLTRPSAAQVEKFVDDIRLLTFAEMKELFPDCSIVREKFLFFFTKSYIAVRV